MNLQLMQFYCSTQHNNNNIVKTVKEKTEKKKKNYFLNGADASFTEDVKARMVDITTFSDWINFRDFSLILSLHVPNEFIPDSEKRRKKISFCCDTWMSVEL